MKTYGWFGAVLAAGLAISLSTPADAAVSLVGSTTNPTGVNGLVVDGTTYNVTFSTRMLNTFTYNTTLSIDAAYALASALNLLNVAGLGGASPTQYFILDVDNVVVAPFDDTICQITLQACNAGGWFEGTAQYGNALGYFSSPIYGVNAGYTEAAVFTPVGVPEPAIWTVMLVGLAGLGAMMRGRKQAVAVSAG